MVKKLQKNWKCRYDLRHSKSSLLFHNTICIKPWGILRARICCYKMLLIPHFWPHNCNRTCYFIQRQSKSSSMLVTVQRSSEEIALVRDEMQRTLNYYSNMLNKVDISLTHFSTCQPSLFARGAISLLHSFRKAVAMRMRICQDHFSLILSKNCNEH